MPYSCEEKSFMIFGIYGGDVSSTSLATGTLDNKLLLRARNNLYMLDADGKEQWKVQLPAPITSNATVTADGNVCVATGGLVHCLTIPATKLTESSFPHESTP